MIRYGRQEITEEDINSVIEVLKSDLLTQGPKVKEFEEKFADYVGAKKSIAVSSGTAALHLCVEALGVTKGTNVITTPITFSATANCVRFCGGNVYFSDIEEDTLLLDPAGVRRLIEKHPKGFFSGIIPVNFTGNVCNMEGFRKIADEYNLWLVEDAAHSPGGYFVDCNGKKQYSGNGNFADLSIFSFHPVKHIACGEGGMITTNNIKLYDKIRKLSSHGITSDPQLFINDISLATGLEKEYIRNEQYPSWYMEMQSLGFNYRITDIQCALGVSQLARAAKNLEKRKLIAKKYTSFFEGKSYVYGLSGLKDGHAYHLYVLQVKDRLGLYNYLRASKIICQIHYVPVHLMPYYKELSGDLRLPVAEKYYSRCISIPMFPTLSDEQQLYIIDKIHNYYESE